jgi:predicted metal-binding membrane protein
MATSRVALMGASLRVGWLWLFVVAAWALAIIATLTGQRALIDHHYLLEQSGLSWPLAAVVFLAAWQVMILAMMAPISISLLTRAAVPLGWLPLHARGAVLAGNAIAWTLFGFLAFSGDTGIHRLVDIWPWLATHTFVIGATTLIVAGLFQFTRGKAACLAFCRDQRAYVSVGGSAHARSAWETGMRHGLASVGSCWALMLIMFGVGVGGLGWMLALTGAMLAETFAPVESRTRQVIGVALLLLAALWLAHPAWLVPISAA